MTRLLTATHRPPNPPCWQGRGRFNRDRQPTANQPNRRPTNRVGAPHQVLVARHTGAKPGGRGTGGQGVNDGGAAGGARGWVWVLGQTWRQGHGSATDPSGQICIETSSKLAHRRLSAPQPCRRSRGWGRRGPRGRASRWGARRVRGQTWSGVGGGPFGEMPRPPEPAPLDPAPSRPHTLLGPPADLLGTFGHHCVECAFGAHSG
jgi:hypothetical protein